MSWRCPECRSENHDSLGICVCGYELVEKDDEPENYSRVSDDAVLIHCNLSITQSDSGFIGATRTRTTTWTYREFPLEMKLNEHNVSFFTCPSCHDKVRFEVFPGLRSPLSSLRIIHSHPWPWIISFYGGALCFPLIASLLIFFGRTPWLHDVLGMIPSSLSVVVGIASFLLFLFSVSTFFEPFVLKIRVTAVGSQSQRKDMTSDYKHQVFFRTRFSRKAKNVGYYGIMGPRGLNLRVPFYKRGAAV